MTDLHQAEEAARIRMEQEVWAYNRAVQRDQWEGRLTNMQPMLLAKAEYREAVRATARVEALRRAAELAEHYAVLAEEEGHYAERAAAFRYISTAIESLIY